MFAFTSHRDNDIPLLVTFLHIPVRLGSLFHREAFINDGFDLPFFNQLFDEDQAFGLSRLQRHR